MSQTSLTETDVGGGDVELSYPLLLPMDPLVSVWMITYNHAAYIREALDSVLMQQVDFPYEICLGEDGSTDGTREICREYLEKHPDKMRLFLRNRQNPARQRYIAPFMYNTAETFDSCRGKYIAMLEGDDFWISTRKLALQTSALEADSRIAVSSHFVLRMAQGRASRASIFLPDTPHCFDLREMLSKQVYVHTSSMVVRRSPSIDWYRFAEMPCGDVPVLFWSLQQGDAHVLQEVMSVYRISDAGVYATQDELAKLQHQYALWKILAQHVPAPARAAQQRGHFGALIQLIIGYRKHNRIMAALIGYRDLLRDVYHSRDCGWCSKLGFAERGLEALISPSFRNMRVGIASRLWRRNRAAVVEERVVSGALGM